MRRVVTVLVVAGLLGVLAAALADAFRGSARDMTPTRATARKDPVRPAGATVTQEPPPCAGERSCWGRDVALEAGFRIVGKTRRAWVLRWPSDASLQRFRFWATRGRRDLRDLGYRRLVVLGGTEIFGNGARYVWVVGQTTAWVESATRLSLPVARLNPLVAASTSSP